jgi:hypothetical protein
LSPVYFYGEYMHIWVQWIEFKSITGIISNFPQFPCVCAGWRCILLQDTIFLHSPFHSSKSQYFSQPGFLCSHQIFVNNRHTFISKTPFPSIALKKIFLTPLANFMEPSPCREAASCAATQEHPKMLWNPKVHYRVHKSPSLFSILSQINPVRNPPSSLSKIHFDIIQPPTSLSS